VPAWSDPGAATPPALRQDLAALDHVLSPFVSTMTRAALLDCALQRIRTAGQPTGDALRAEVARGLRLFVENPEIAARCASHVLALGTGGARPAAPAPGALRVPVRTEEDIVRARRAVRDLATTIGFAEPARVKLATAVSELVRNAVAYGGGGEAEMQALGGRPGLQVRVSDRGPGIPMLQDALAGRHRSRTGISAGLRGARALVDDFEVETAPGAGTRITLRKFL
jgi:serine/threonine-protein kinase RsbT